MVVHPNSSSQQGVCVGMYYLIKSFYLFQDQENRYKTHKTPGGHFPAFSSFIQQRVTEYPLALFQEDTKMNKTWPLPWCLPASRDKHIKNQGVYPGNRGNKEKREIESSQPNRKTNMPYTESLVNNCKLLTGPNNFIVTRFLKKF